MLAALLLGAAAAGHAAATSHGGINVITGRAELAPSGEAFQFQAGYEGLAPSSEVVILVDYPGAGVSTQIDEGTLPAGCGTADNAVICEVEGTGSITIGLTATVTDAEAECPINPTTTFPDPCFQVRGQTFDSATHVTQPLAGVIITMRPADADDDGIDDSIDASALQSDAFDDGATYGAVTDRAGMAVYVSDLASDGVEVIVRPMSGASVTMELCGEPGFTTFSAGGRAVVTCGSVTVGVIAGTVVRHLGDGVRLTIGAGSTATTTDSGGVVVEEGSAVLQTTEGTQTILPEDGEVPIGGGDPDTDGDGLTDAIDPDALWAELAAIADGHWANGGAPKAVRSILDDVQDALLMGDIDGALDGLEVLLKRSDGGSNDWMSPEVSAAFHAAVAERVALLNG
jgi:hypothetical protein